MSESELTKTAPWAELPNDRGNDAQRRWTGHRAGVSGRVPRAHYEDAIEDLAGNVRRILDFCGLEFDPLCLEFHKTQHSVSTANSEQVRQPLFRDGLWQRRHCEASLGALREALGDALARYRE